MKFFRKIKRAHAALSERKYTTVAGTLVFFLIMSLVPFSFWLVLLFGSAGLHVDEILSLKIFDWAKDLLLFLGENAAGATTQVSVFFLITTLWSSTSFFYHLRRSGEILYDYRRNKRGWRVRLGAVLLTFCVLLFFAAAGGILVWVNYFARLLPRPFFYLSVYPVLLVLGFFAAWLLNHYVCPYRCKPLDTALGSFYTALAWLAASLAFSLYLRFSNQERLYGALSLVIVFLLWLYWMMICFTAGVVYNRHRMKVREMAHKTL